MLRSGSDVEGESEMKIMFATTNETMGFVGCKEDIAGLAIAEVR